MKEDKILKTLNWVDKKLEKIAIILLMIAVPLNIIGFGILVLLFGLIAIGIGTFYFYIIPVVAFIICLSSIIYILLKRDL